MGLQDEETHAESRPKPTLFRPQWLNIHEKQIASLVVPPSDL
jgi:hypothetical protein